MFTRASNNKTISRKRSTYLSAARSTCSSLNPIEITVAFCDSLIPLVVELLLVLLSELEVEEKLSSTEPALLLMTERMVCAGRRLTTLGAAGRISLVVTFNRGFLNGGRFRFGLALAMAITKSIPFFRRINSHL